MWKHECCSIAKIKTRSLENYVLVLVAILTAWSVVFTTTQVQANPCSYRTPCG
jgi:N-acetylglutamate synthase/N-acetylornithine aminotransferase